MKNASPSQTDQRPPRRPRIHRLDPETVRRIAAGEVVERPASVLKELIENALDAGARRLEIRIEAAGKRLIEVRDDGCGMERDDLEVLFERHATSKITGPDDLKSIQSFGFRGEALYSIGAVADVTVKTRPHQADTGWAVHIRGGERLSLKPTAVSPGTQVSVRELFFNTPARRKFLKTDTTEMAQNIAVTLPYALWDPQLRATLIHNDRTVFDLVPVEDRRARVAEALGLDREHLIETRGLHAPSRAVVEMILGDINLVRPRRDLQYFFVNARPVGHKTLSFHLNDVYQLLLPPRQYGVFVVGITIAPSFVDANIHPTKREVKLQHDQSLAAFVRRLAEEALMKYGRPKTAAVLDRPQPAGSSPEPPPPTGPSSPRPPQAYDTRHPAEKDHPPAWDEGFVMEPPTIPQLAPTGRHTVPSSEIGRGRDITQALFENQDPTQRGIQPLRDAVYVGGVMNKYLIFEHNRCLILVDQHAAQERILFERLVDQLRRRHLEIQSRLLPVTLTLNPTERVLWEAMQNGLKEIGFETTAFDDETIAIHSHPALIKDPAFAVREILAKGETALHDHEDLARRACRASVKSGDALTYEEIDRLRKDLLQCSDPYTCPHGRPTFVVFNESFLDKHFLRTR